MRAIKEIIHEPNIDTTREFFDSDEYSPEKRNRVTLEGFDISNPKVREAVTYAKKWQQRLSQEPGASFVLSSQGSGVGKTHIAEAILWTDTITSDFKPLYADQGQVPVETWSESYPANPFLEASDLFAQLTADKPLPIEKFIDPKTDRFVVIDDIGTEVKGQYIAADYWNTYRTGVWFKVFNYCYRYRIGMVITTNIQLGEPLKNWIGKRSFDRLMEMAPKGYMRDLSGVPSRRVMNSGR